MTMVDARDFMITRLFDAPRDLVFQAWTDPAHLARWFGPQGCTTPRDTVSTDVRPGGEWRATMIRDDNGQEYPTGGVYREVDEPSRLAFTWADPTAPVGSPAESLVSIELTEREGKTEMTFRQIGFRTAEERDGVHGGWSSGFDKLGAYLAGGAR
jgi:uncharacterized protein YndB with AHSA1/START domain